MSAPAALWLALGLCAAPGSADVSLVLVVQTQTGGAADARLAKSLVEVARGRMRLVSAVASKGFDKERPWRVVEVLDLPTTSAIVLDPDERTWERRPLGRYIDGPPAGAGARPFSVVDSSITITPGTYVRKCLGADCSHYHVVATMSLRDAKGRRRRARLEQDIWMAPLTGDAQKGLLDLIAFEAEFRRQSGSALSPLDRQTYQSAEAAKHIGVPRSQLDAVLSRVRTALSDVPGYPLVSAVAWWSDRPAKAEHRPKAPPRNEPQLLQEPPPPPPRPRRAFVRIDWHGGWKRLDRALAGAQEGVPVLNRQPAPQPPPVLERYDAFQAELAAIVEQLDQRRAPDRPAVEPAKPGAEDAAEAKESRLYEAFSEIGELVFVGGIPDERFKPPAGFRPK